MQNRPLEDVSISYCEIDFPEDFPISFIAHLQRYQSGGALHFHNGIEIGICHEGSGVFFIDNRIIPFGPGDVSVIFPDQPHIAQSPDENPSRWSFLTVDAERLFCDMSASQFRRVKAAIEGGHCLSGILPGAEYKEISSLVGMIFKELEDKQNDYRLAVKGLMLSLLLMVARLSGADAESGTGAAAEDIMLLSPAVSHICAHYGEPVSVPELAKLCNLSVTHFRRLFRRTMGRAPSEYLLEVRMRMARSLLKSTGLSISEVAMSTGYDSISSFNRHFKQNCGVSPREYRKQLR